MLLVLGMKKLLKTGVILMSAAEVSNGGLVRHSVEFVHTSVDRILN